ncbi:MAG: TolC family protein [Candidatus Thiodiazotropha sp. (ex Monitilora ramsayi)]|nr:TolC family protein [Candidatus Thiodiazotropha sp. (ex Monitilora ramsayi)]
MKIFRTFGVYLSQVVCSCALKKNPIPLSVFILLLAFWSSINSAEEIQSYDLEQAISTALENNRLRTISQQSLDIAEAQYQQARSTYWPSLSLNASFQRRDEKAIFEYPEQTFNVAPGLLPPVTVPAQDIEMLGRDTSLYSVEMNYPIYTGGKRSSLIEQARIGVDIASKEIRRTELQVVQDVKRYYYAAIYTQQLKELAEDITISFEVLRDITQAFYEGGSNSVNKLDLLQSKLAYALAASTLSELESKHKSALAALTFTMGLNWQDVIHLSTSDYPSPVEEMSLDALIDQAMQFNPVVDQLSLAVEAFDAKVDLAKSDYYPTVGLRASFDRFNNDLDGGLSIEENERSWQLGIGMQLKLFNGGRTKHQVSAAKIARNQTDQKRLLVKDSIAMKVKHLFIQTQAARKQIQITDTAVDTSFENRDLSNRAYQTGAVKTEKVIEASLLDAMVRASHARATHDQALHLAEIAYLLGSEALE